MNITLNKSAAYMTRLLDTLIALYPSRAAEIRVEGAGNSVRVYTTEPGSTNPAETDMDATLTPLVNGYMALTVTATAPVTNVPKTTITVNGTDETHIKTVPQAAFNYTLWRGLHDSEGDFVLIELDSTGAAGDGVLELSAVDAGVYLVEVKSGNNTGYIEIEATL